MYAALTLETGIYNSRSQDHKDATSPLRRSLSSYYWNSLWDKYL